MQVPHAFYRVFAVSHDHTAFPEQYNGISPKTLYVHHGDLAELPCDYQPGRAHSLYHVTWVERSIIPSSVYPPPPSSPHQNVSVDNYSLFLVADRTVDGISYQCFVDVTSCSGACLQPAQTRLFGAEVIVQLLGKWVFTYYTILRLF